MSRLRRLSLGLGGIVLGLLVLEAALRLFGGAGFDPTESARWHRWPHPVLGWKLKPDIEFLHRSPVGEYATVVRTNSRGWRDRERSLEKAPGSFRIVVLGDSFMEAVEVEREESFSHLLEEELGPDVEVLNLSVGGFGTLQEYLVFQEEAHLYSPDLVLLAFHAANDPANNSRQITSRIGREESLASTPFLSPTSLDGSWNITSVDYENALQTFRDNRRTSFWSHSAIANFIDKAQRARSRSPALVAFRQHLTDLYSETPSREVEESWQLTQRILGRLKVEVERSGARLVIFHVPALWEVREGFVYAPIANPSGPERRLRDLCQRLDLPLLSLTPAFRAAEAQSPLPALYFSTDLHWNSRGHALAAETIAAELLRRGFLDSRVGEPRRDPGAFRDGDGGQIAIPQHGLDPVTGRY